MLDSTELREYGKKQQGACENKRKCVGLFKIFFFNMKS